MKKIFSFFMLAALVFSLVVCFAACGGGSSNPPSYSYEPETLTQSEKEEIAEAATLKKIAATYPFSKDGTRYEIGSVGSRYSGEVVINGKLYTYDKYGDYEDSYTFTAVVSVDENGEARVESFDYKVK